MSVCGLLVKSALNSATRSAALGCTGGSALALGLKVSEEDDGDEGCEECNVAGPSVNDAAKSPFEDIWT